MNEEQYLQALEDFEERSAIHQHEAGYSRATAESMALRYVSEHYGTEIAKRIYYGGKRHEPGTADS